MKIMLLDVNYGNSSTGKIVQALAECARNKGHQVRVLYGRSSNSDNPDGIMVSPFYEPVIHAALTRLTGFEGRFSPKATARIKSEILKFEPDIIHLNDMHGYWVNTLELLMFMNKLDIKIVWTFHCEYPYTGKCGHAFECTKWMSQCRDCPQVREYPKSLFFDRSKSQFASKKQLAKQLRNLTIICPSSWLAERAKKSIFSDFPIKIIYNGVDTEIFRPTNTNDFARTDRNLIVGCIGRDLFGGNKGGDIMLKVAKELVQVDFLAFDSEHFSHKNRYPNVTFLPRLSPTELSKALSRIDVFLLTSRRETFSLMAAEALACGARVIGLDSGAPAEIVRHAFLGELIEERDVFRLPQLIVDSSERWSEADEMNVALRRHNYIADEFSISTMCERYIDAYTSA